MHKSQEQASPHIELLFWITLFVILISNFMYTIVIIPLILLSSGASLLVIILLGFLAGYIFSHLMKSIQRLGMKHHLIAAILIPGLSAANLFIMIGISGKISQILGMPASQSPYSLFIAYTIAFLAPYLWLNVLKKKAD